mmetsp:Transcript_91100/g.240953  ORF Transcript_91100/g.240953 Transcript_91100/m.240953 type:complete len:362 (-) Transcript_91100:196-1281(-)
MELRPAPQFKLPLQAVDLCPEPPLLLVEPAVHVLLRRRNVQEVLHHELRGGDLHELRLPEAGHHLFPWPLHHVNECAPQRVEGDLVLEWTRHDALQPRAARRVRRGAHGHPRGLLSLRYAPDGLAHHALHLLGLLLPHEPLAHALTPPLEPQRLLVEHREVPRRYPARLLVGHQRQAAGVLFGGALYGEPLAIPLLRDDELRVGQHGQLCDSGRVLQQVQQLEPHPVVIEVPVQRASHDAPLTRAVWGQRAAFHGDPAAVVRVGMHPLHDRLQIALDDGDLGRSEPAVPGLLAPPLEQEGVTVEHEPSPVADLAAAQLRLGHHASLPLAPYRVPRLLGRPRPLVLAWLYGLPYPELGRRVL